MEPEIADIVPSGRGQEIQIKIKNISKSTRENIRVSLLTTPYIRPEGDKEATINRLEPQETRTVTLKILARGSDSGRANLDMVGLSCSWDSRLPYHKEVAFKYVKVQ